MKTEQEAGDLRMFVVEELNHEISLVEPRYVITSPTETAPRLLDWKTGRVDKSTAQKEGLLDILI